MIEFIALALVLALVVFWRSGNSLRALLIAWLVAVVPSAIGLISYSYQYAGSIRFVLFIGSAILFFMIGYFGYYYIAGYKVVEKLKFSRQRYDVYESLRQPIIVVAIIAFLAIVFMVLDAITSGIDVSNLASIREEVISRESASVLARLASVTTWACFLCLVFAVYFRDRLSRPAIFLLLALGAGTVLSSLFSAGRQSLLQTFFLLLFVEGYRQKDNFAIKGGGLIGRVLIVTLVIVVLLYVSITRARSDYGLARLDILLRLFGADLSPTLRQFLSGLPIEIGDFFAEAILYIGHSVPLFSAFADIQFPEYYLGQNSFPFVFRQIESLTGLSVQSTYLTKIQYLNGAGLFGVGWTTALSQTGMDFGLIGTAIFFAVIGVLAKYWDLRAAHIPGIIPSIMSSMFMIFSIYTPYFLLTTDTSMLLLLIFVSLLSIFMPTLNRRYLHPQRGGAFGADSIVQPPERK